MLIMEILSLQENSSQVPLIPTPSSRSIEEVALECMDVDKIGGVLEENMPGAKVV